MVASNLLFFSFEQQRVGESFVMPSSSHSRVPFVRRLFSISRFFTEVHSLAHAHSITIKQGLNCASVKAFDGLFRNLWTLTSSWGKTSFNEWVAWATKAISGHGKRPKQSSWFSRKYLLFLCSSWRVHARLLMYPSLKRLRSYQCLNKCLSLLVGRSLFGISRR